MTLTSPKSQLYIAIEKRLKDLVPELRMIDIDYGQLDFYQERPAVSMPCVLIDFPNMSFDNLGANVQWANVSISVRLGCSPFSSSSSMVPDLTKALAMQYFEIENKVYQALHGWVPVIEVDGEDMDIAQPLVRMSSDKERREDPFIVMAMLYTTAGEDQSVENEVVKRQSGLEIDNGLGN